MGKQCGHRWVYTVIKASKTLQQMTKLTTFVVNGALRVNTLDTKAKWKYCVNLGPLYL